MFFAINYSFVKTISPTLIGPYALNLFRVGGSLVLFWTLWLFARNRTSLRKQDVGRLILCGLLGVTINQMLFTKGLTMTTAIHASLLALSSPILITLLAFWMLNEGITLIKVVGLAFGVVGSYWLIAGKQGSGQPENYLLGDLMIVLNGISYAFYFILVKPLMERYSALEVVRWAFTFGFIMAIPIGWTQVQNIHWSQFEGADFTRLVFIILAGTFLAYTFNAFGIRMLGSSVTSAYIYIQLVFAVSIAVIFFGEHLTLQKVIAGVMILAGVYLVGMKKRQ